MTYRIRGPTRPITVRHKVDLVTMSQASSTDSGWNLNPDTSDNIGGGVVGMVSKNW